ncbi:putative Late embryogenesis abundant protein, LEA_2 subgroup [Helianthus debilis subsp. tardiflorus]
MTDRVYPSSKPKPNTTTKTTAAGGGGGGATTTPNRNIPPPPNKTQFNTTTTSNNRHPYRPNPTTTTHRRRRRSCFCLCCFWLTLIILLLLLISTIAGCILYLLYHPHRPTFSIAALKISQFNLSTTSSDDTTRLTSKLNLTLSTSNPNKKITFFYDPFTITLQSHETQLANGSFPNSLTIKPNNITIIHSQLYTTSLLLDPEIVTKIRSDLKKKSGMPLKLLLDTEVRVKIETLRTKKVGIRIECDGIHSLIPKGGGTGRNTTASSAVAATVTAAKCKLDLRIKIWKWTF